MRIRKSKKNVEDITIKYISESEYVLEKAHSSDVGYDLMAINENQMVIEIGQWKTVNT